MSPRKSKRHAKSKPAATTSPPPFSRRLLWSIRGAALVAMALSGYLLWGSLSGDRLPGCGPDSGCDAVLSSRWAYWLGLPVSLAALATYAAVIGTTVGLSRPQPDAKRRRRLSLLLGMGFMVLGAAIWFVGVQIFALRAICPYCMTAHGFGAAMAILIFWSTRGNAGSARSNAGPRAQRSGPAGLGYPALGAIGALTVLVAGQVLYRPATFRVQRGQGAPPPATATAGVGLSSNAAGAGAVAAAAGQTSAVQNDGGPFLELHGGAFRLNLAEVPLLGSPNAPHVMVSLFDYTCSHCRAAHRPLAETQRALSNQLAIVNLPVPLDRTCNPTVQRQLSAHTNACMYARLGLAVWRANRAQSSAFDDWLFAGPTPPSTQQAFEHARQLVGTNAFAEAFSERWIEELLAQSVRLHRTNAVRYGKSQLPQLILGADLAVGSFDRTADVLGVVCQQFGLAVPAH